MKNTPEISEAGNISSREGYLPNSEDHSGSSTAAAQVEHLHSSRCRDGVSKCRPFHGDAGCRLRLHLLGERCRERALGGCLRGRRDPLLLFSYW